MKFKDFNLAEHIKAHTFPFIFPTKIWEEYRIDKTVIDALSWNEIKFLNDKGDDYSKEINNIPNNKGGIYLFIIKCNILNNISDYLVYIGRAQLTTTHNLQKRCKKYFNEYINNDERPKISTMINYFGKYLYLKYAIVDDNDTIQILEADLINTLLPPFNDSIPDKRIREAINAF